MRSGRFLFLPFAIALALHLGTGSRCDAAATPALDEGARIESLPVGATTYRHVQVRSITAHTVIITHAGGMASIRLRDLSPEWQARFHYDPAAPVAPPPSPAARLPTAPRAAVSHPVMTRETSTDRLLRQFGQPAVPQASVDLRPKFFALELGVKDQGRRPSCAIFAVVSALEYQNAEVSGTPQKFSEEYLTWAVRKTSQRVAPAAPIAPTVASEDSDTGFTLAEVVAALRGYGIPLQASMPNTFGRGIETIEDPPPAIVAEAQQHQRVFVHAVPGRDHATRINNVVHALNAGVPVAVGLAWPPYRALRTGFLSGQTPLEGRGHAVTLVGYQCASGRIEDAVFFFKNSWGVAWGQGGYGTVTYGYLQKHLHDTALLEVQPSGSGT